MMKRFLIASGLLAWLIVGAPAQIGVPNNGSPMIPNASVPSSSIVIGITGCTGCTTGNLLSSSAGPVVADSGVTASSLNQTTGQVLFGNGAGGPTSDAGLTKVAGATGAVSFGGPGLFPAGNTTNPGIGFVGQTNLGFTRSSNVMRAVGASGNLLEFGANYMSIPNAVVLNWSVLGVSNNITLQRDADGILAQLSGVNPMVYRIYNTFTSATSFERGVSGDWQTTSNVFTMGTQKGSGGGSARDVSFVTGGIEFLRGNSATNNPKFRTSSTGAGLQTFTNSPCTTLSTEQYIPVEITGQTGTWFVAACQ